jgi:hypothetical protein
MISFFLFHITFKPFNNQEKFDLEKVLRNSLAPFRFLTPFSIRSSRRPWGQALPPGEDTFLPLALMAFPEIRPDPDILAARLRRIPSPGEGCMVKKP